MASCECCILLADAIANFLEVDKLTPGDCYDAKGQPNANWGRIDNAALRAALAKATGD